MFASILLSLALASPADFAVSSQVDAWMHHPVVGDVSFDAFERAEGNPIVQGTPPMAWPVNGFLFHDPVSGRDYAYVGEYASGYALTPGVASRCVVLRQEADGHWENLGPIFGPEPHVYEGEVSPVYHAPDVSVVYEDGRYHLCFDWTTQNTTWENASAPPAEANSGVGYAWAERPEGPFHHVARPIATTREQVPLLGKYRRLYASTLIRRASDWLVLTLTDSGPHFGWALMGRTSTAPEGPYSEPTLLLYPESPRYLPPLLEYFPAFTHEGYIYSPATSVARNRNYQALFRAPIEKATEPGAWEAVQFGSMWHAEPVPHEAAGIWGQTLSGYVDTNATLKVLFPSRTLDNFGTISIAQRSWAQPLRERGFVVSAHGGPSLALLQRTGELRSLDLELEARGTWSLIWDAAMPIGPDRPASDSMPHPHTLAYHTGLRIGEGTWTLYQRGLPGEERIIAQGAVTSLDTLHVRVERNGEGATMLHLGDILVWQGSLPHTSGMPGLLMEPGSWARVTRLEVDGELAPAPLTYVYTEALCGAAQRTEDWDARVDSAFRYGVGAVSKAADARAKWNFEGSGFVIWAPRGPGFGSARVLVDGVERGELNFHRDAAAPSAEVFRQARLATGRHTVILESLGQPIPVDCLAALP